ncbi:hypothetical protein AB5J56_21790 [Streptomyces sp. R21]|uniref:Uncharacterized protein n=1 Tax=Streptomyces sp. R21 TaxID=3238627 RepID=A0AB39P7Y8_9ACTN
MILLAAAHQANQGIGYLITALAGFWSASVIFRLRRKKMTGSEPAVAASPARVLSLTIAAWLVVALSLFLVVAAVLFLAVGPM